eukprot:764185-Hanusia_phi.AAC.3
MQPFPKTQRADLVGCSTPTGRFVTPRTGGIMSAFVASRVARVPFLYAAGRFYYKLGLSEYREFPLLRFGFNGNPYLDPHSATLLPNGLGEKESTGGLGEEEGGREKT